MHLITETAINLWKTGRKTKRSSSGWLSGNAVCCHHRGENIDTKGRGGLVSNDKGGFTWHCFNCGFKAGWTPGKGLSENTKKLFLWLGLPELEVQKLNLVALKLRDESILGDYTLNFNLHKKSLPKNSFPILEWIDEHCDDAYFLNVLDYVVNTRKIDLSWYPLYWSPDEKFKNSVIVPFYYENDIVGFAARMLGATKQKYFSDSQSGYVLNMDAQTYNRNFVIVVEGVFDAIAIDGVAILTNDPNEVQCARINGLSKRVIVVPDKDDSGSKLVEAAINHGWDVSLPQWENDIKDVADAVAKYGRIYTLYSILHYAESNTIKKELIRRSLQNAKKIRY